MHVSCRHEIYSSGSSRCSWIRLRTQLLGCHPRLHRSAVPPKNMPYLREIRCLYSTFHNQLDARCDVHHHECCSMGQPYHWRVKSDRRRCCSPDSRSLLRSCRSEEPRVHWEQDFGRARTCADDCLAWRKD